MEIILKEISYKDIKWFYEFNKKEEISKWIKFSNFSEIDDVIDWFYKYNEKILNDINDEYIFTIINEDGDRIGYSQIFNYDSINKKAEIGIMIDPQFQKIGYGNIALIKTENIAFEKMKINKLSAIIREDNLNSINFFIKYGFKQEGLLKDELFQDNRYWDIHILSKKNK